MAFTQDQKATDNDNKDIRTSYSIHVLHIY